MKRIFLLAFLFSGTTIMNGAKLDTLRISELQEVVVNGVKAHQGEPFAVSEIDRKELNGFSKTGKELPFLFSKTPAVIAWSENGLGTGTTYMRIRGAGDTRINVTLDGVPLNSPEDQCVFWANMNSYSAIMGSVQIQRGIGTSTNGDGAFGGTVALNTKLPSPLPSAEITASYGSYNTAHMGATFSTGIIKDKVIIDGAYNQTSTDGYIHGTQGNSGSYYGGLLWTINDNIMLRYRNIGNFEKTGQAWNGVTAGNDDLSLMDGVYGVSTGIKSYKDIYEAGLGRYNSLYEMLVTNPDGSFKQDENGKYLTQRYEMNDGSYWNRTTDNFWQDHNILTLAWKINEKLSSSLQFHYTYGYGYYSEFRYNNKLKKFGLSNFTDSQNNTIKKSDFVRKKGLDQQTYGAIWNIQYKADRLDIRGGIAAQQFEGNHFGDLIYVSNPELSDYLLQNGKYKYYDSDAKKFDGNTYVKANFKMTESWTAFADLQYRHVGYMTDGYNDKYIDNGDGTYSKHYLDIDKNYDFFSPKIGLNFNADNHNAYILIARNSREPERNNFTDNGNYPSPVAERMTDIEAGYGYTSDVWYANANIYYMDYTDQFVQTGAKSDIGENLTTNIKDSYRTGIELSAGWNPLSWLSIEGNAALSSNKIKDFDEVVEDWDNGSQTIHYDNSTLSFSPSTILNGFINLHYKALQATWHTNYVSSQYLDNTENSDRSLPCYSTTGIDLSYTLGLSKKGFGPKEIVFGMNFNNIFNRHYAASGWVYSAIAESYGHTNENRYYQIGFIPMADFTTMGNITIKF